MLKPSDVTPKKRKPPTKINTSSRTLTPRSKHRKDKKKLTRRQVEAQVQKMSKNKELLLDTIFSEEDFDETIKSHTDKKTARRARVYTPHITMSLFVQQVLTKDCSCSDMVTEFNKQRMTQGRREVSTNTTSYCAARVRVPLKAIEQLTKQTAALALDSLPKKWLWHGHRVLLVDGMVINAPDTPENQAAYPQPSSQEPGLGFPQIRLCASICLTTGVVSNLAYSPVSGKSNGEQTLFRKMYPSFSAGDIVVGDSNFECYRDMAMLYEQGIFMVCDINGSRQSPFSGACQCTEETIETWNRPGFDKSRFTTEQWERMPETLNVRVIRYCVNGRNTEKTIVTTLLDSQKYSAQAVLDLYRQRWECELDFRSIKTLMGMNWLSCHSPEMLQRELMTYILAYNLIRIVMADAAKLRQTTPRDLSFKKATNSWIKFESKRDSDNGISWLLWTIADAPLRKRPGRREPRKIKRRSSKYAKMNRPRALEKAELSA